jgi:serine protease Do
MLQRPMRTPASADMEVNAYAMFNRPVRLPAPRWVQGLAWAVVACGLLLPGVSGRASELRKTAIVKAVQRIRDSVVNIKGEKTVAAGGTQAGTVEPGSRVNGMGTGVILDSRGYIITNYHVVDGVREIQVTTAAGDRFLGHLMARDPETDLAIVKVDPPAPLPVVSLGTSSDLMLGEPVIAVGNAYGYEHTVTLGIISALHRAVKVSDAQFYEDLIQTDASINPGNSGGPLSNVDGEMIGINVAVRAGAQGIGFAIPVDKAVAVAGDLLAGCGAKRFWHGLVPARQRKGTVIEAVEKESPAAEAGLLAGDSVLAVGDLSVEHPLDFQRALLEGKAGDQVKMLVKRGEQPLSITLRLAEPARDAKGRSYPIWDLLGLELKPVPDDEFRRQYQTRYRGGLAVLAVRPHSPASLQGIRRGDVLVGMHIWETVSLENVLYVVNRPDFSTINPVRFFIFRGTETLYGYLSVAGKPTEQR